MEIVKINFSNPDISYIEKAVKVVRLGGVIVYPTDTVYGLGADALRISSIERLFKIKKRPLNKPVPVMVKDIEMAEEIAFIDDKTKMILKKIWPGPVTVVLRKRSIVPTILTAGRENIGLRIPDCLVCEKIMEILDAPITCTSANISGESPCVCSEDVIKAFKDYPRPDLILDAGCIKHSLPSTVLDLTGKKPKFLRIGPVNKKDLLKILGI